MEFTRPVYDYLSKLDRMRKQEWTFLPRVKDYALNMKTVAGGLFLFAAFLLGVSSGVIGTMRGQGTAAPPSKKDTRTIDSLPAPKDEAIRKILDGRHWLNPYIITYVEGYELTLHDQPRTEVRLNLDELETALLRLPLDRWPLGKVVAVQESGIGVDLAHIPQKAENLTALRRMLKSHGIRVDLWPPA